MLLLVAPLLAAFAASALATRSARDVAVHYDRLDRPDERKLHARAVPRVGGIGIAAGAAVGLTTLLVLAALTEVDLPLGPLWPVVVGGAAVFALGLWDDFAAVGFKTRFLVQAGVAWAMTLTGWHVDLSNVPLVENLGVFEQAAISVPLTVLWTVGLINAMNLLDGLDTLAGGTALVGFVALGLAFAPAADAVMMAICGLGIASVGGFLVHNRHPATVFMGDGGSTLLGFLLAMAGIRGVMEMPSGGLVILPVVALGLPILDTLTQMVRRAAVGVSPFQADADHLHHRVLARNKNVPAAVARMHLVAAVFGTMAVLLRFSAGKPLWQAMILTLTAVLSYAFVRRLGYVRTRDLVRAVRTYVERGVERRQRTNRARQIRIARQQAMARQQEVTVLAASHSHAPGDGANVAMAELAEPVG